MNHRPVWCLCNVKHPSMSFFLPFDLTLQQMIINKYQLRFSRTQVSVSVYTYSGSNDLLEFVIISTITQRIPQANLKTCHKIKTDEEIKIKIKIRSFTSEGPKRQTLKFPSARSLSLLQPAQKFLVIDVMNETVP